MMLLQTADRREARYNLWLGGSTAIAAGLVNVCSVMAFFAFSSNVTGHVAIFTEEIVKGHWHQVSVVLIWLALFLLGAFVANLIVITVGPRNVFIGHSAPAVLEMLALTGVAYYGHNYYLETLTETEYLVGALLFTMGLQNGMVATISNFVVRTTHLTGLFTDLGMELSMMTQARFRRDASVRFKLKLHVIILAGYLAGGLLGGAVYLRHGFQALYLASVLLGLIVIYDLAVLWLSRKRQAWTWSWANGTRRPNAEPDK
jgi:uncharacterized membrane protein YoaK (UPF0700 family)